MENKENFEKSDMMAKARNHQRRDKSTRNINKLWLWLGVLILIAILIYWLFSIDIMESLSGSINGN